MARKKGKPGAAAKSEEKAPQHGIFREYFITIVVCTVFALFLTTYVVHPMSVPTPSMEPTILIGDRVLVDKFTIRNGFSGTPPLVPTVEIRRHDVIVCKSPIQPEILLVKRVVGLPGDELEIRNKQVYIDGQRLEEPFKQHSDPNVYRGSSRNPFLDNIQRDNFGPVTLPADSFFVMGDNRDDSLDSRFWGFLPRRNIVGRPLFIFWSFEDPKDAHLKSSPGELIQLYLERVVFFLTRTRWSRMGMFVR